MWHYTLASYKYCVFFFVDIETASIIITTKHLHDVYYIEQRGKD